MEIYWSTSAQIYVTPVATDTVCVALISRDPHGRIEDALPRFPEIASRLEHADVVTSERGAITGTRWLHAVHRKNVVLIGDASGSVDAITGEGLCLAFQQAIALANALDQDDLSIYTAAHNRIARKPGFMATLMLALDSRPALRAAIFRTLTANPGIFREMLAMHVGDLRASAIWSSGVALTLQILAGGSARIAGRKI
jgi:flavin-dependent dehydrogenase